MVFRIAICLALSTVVNCHSNLIAPRLAQCHVNHVILDEFGDEISYLYIGATLKLVCVCEPGTIEPFLTKTIYKGYDKEEGTNRLVSEYFSTTDGVVTIKVTAELSGTRFWCQNSHHYLQIPNEPICDSGNEPCYTSYCSSDQSVCLDSRNDQKVFKQVCVAGQQSVRVQADLCRHVRSGSSDAAVMEVAQPTVCPSDLSKLGGFITVPGNLIQIGTVRVVNDLYAFSTHRIKCHNAVTPSCYLVRKVGKVSKVAVCGRCSQAGDIVNATVTTKQLRGGTHFHRQVDPKCRVGKLICGDGKNFRIYVYLVLSGTKYFIPDDNSYENVPICDWWKQPLHIQTGDGPFE